MFRCQKCLNVSVAGEKPVRIVIETRPKEYFEERVNFRDNSVTVVKVGEGYETVRELTVCEKCVEATK